MTDESIRPAASMLLFRDSDTGPEVLLLQRPEHVSFGGAWVFPGGALDSADADPGLVCHCDIDAAAASGLLALPDDGLRWLIAAVRELFEEAGILLAQYSGDHAGDHAADHEVARRALLRNDTDFISCCSSGDWQLALSEMRFVSYWVAPDWVSPRYATRFFAARLPAGQHCQPDGVEALDYRWIRPEVAIDEAQALRLPRPTLDNLHVFCGFADVAELLNSLAANRAEQQPVVWPRRVDGELIMDADPDELRNLQINWPSE